MELECFGPFVLHLKRGLQTLRAEGDTVHEPKFVRPRLAEFLTQHVGRQAKVELDRIMRLALVAAQRLGRRFAQELPVRAACEAVLRQSGRGVVLWRGTEDLDVDNQSRSMKNLYSDCRKKQHTGNTTGMPPRMAFEPSRWALELTNSCSSPLASFHDVTVAPYRYTCTDSPEGRVASMRLSWMVTVGWGREAATPMAAGLLERSIAPRRLVERT